jgi:hypothetical protein
MSPERRKELRILRFRNLLPALAVSALALGVVACNDDEGDADAGAPAVSFTSPTDGDTVSGPVTAEVELTDFTINPDAVGKGSVEGEGHLHFSMDEGKYDTPKYSGANGELARDLGVEGQYSPAVEPTITYEGLPPGEHTLEVYLANNDHSDTGVEASVTVTVEG